MDLLGLWAIFSDVPYWVILFSLVAIGGCIITVVGVILAILRIMKK